MALTSADRAFGIIALQRKLLTKEALAAEEKALEEKHANGIDVPLAQHLITIGKLDANQRSEVERIRSKHGRDCEKCARTTFLLPGETPEKKPCEHCGGPLKKTATAPAAAAAPPTVPGPTAMPATAAPGAPRPPFKIERSPLRPTPAPEAPAGGPATPAAKPAVANADLDDAAKKERLKRLRQGGAFGYEPPPPGSTPAPAAAYETSLAPEAAPAAPVPAPTVESTAVAPPAPAPVDDPAPGFSRRPAPTFGPPEVAAGPVIPNLPFFDELKTVLAFPFRPQIIMVLTVGAVVGSVMRAVVGIFGFLILLYFCAWQVKVTNHVTNGKTEDIPDWPDLGEIGGLAGRLFLCNLSCFVPLIAIVLILAALPGRHASSADVESAFHFTVGDDQHKLSGPGRAVGNVVADEELVDAHDSTVKISDYHGRWLVLGLIDVDDSTDQVLHRGIPNQMYDLDRLARADPSVTVLALVVDPGQRIMKRLGLVVEDGEHSPTPPELQKVRVLRPRSSEFAMPEKFGKVSHAPAVYFVDPNGKIVLEFDSGASDHAIYGALVDLKKGGNGSAKPKPLPGERGASASLAFASLGLGLLVVLAGLLFVVVYHPMAYLMTVVFTNGTLPFNYAAGLGAIGRTAGEYAKLVAILLAAGIAGNLLSFLLEDVLLVPFPVIAREIGAGVASWWVLLYGMVVEAYALGRFYLRNKTVLGWF